MSKLNGVDVSGWQSGIDTYALTADFVIVKATEGTQGTIYNPEYRTMADRAAESGKLIGFYHYANGGDPIAEATCFHEAIRDYKGRAVYALDWEGQGNPTFQSGRDVEWCRKFMARIDVLMGGACLLYMSKSECNAYDWSSVADHPLWGAEYATMDTYQGYQATPWESSAEWGAWGRYVAIHQYGFVNPKPNNGGYGSLDADILHVDGWQEWMGTKSPSEREEVPVATRVSLGDIAATIHYDMCVDEANGYEQRPERWGGDSPLGSKTIEIAGRRYTYRRGSYDCSSSVITAWRLALKGTPYEGRLDAATYTGDMRKVFLASGLFTADMKPAKRGDVYLAESRHTAMCQDGGSDGVMGYDCLSEFSRNEKHGASYGQVGDQDGQESVVRPYYDDGWNTVLHYNGKADYDVADDKATPTPTMVETQEEDEMICLIHPDDESTMYYFDGSKLRPLAHQDEQKALEEVYAATHGGKAIPKVKLGTSTAPLGARLKALLKR